MNIPIDLPPLKGFRYPREIITFAVWAYHRLALSTADIEDLLAARGVIVSREAIRLWVNRFGSHFADRKPPRTSATCRYVRTLGTLSVIYPIWGGGSFHDERRTRQPT